MRHEKCHRRRSVIIVACSVRVGTQSDDGTELFGRHTYGWRECRAAEGESMQQ